MAAAVQIFHGFNFLITFTISFPHTFIFLILIHLISFPHIYISRITFIFPSHTFIFLILVHLISSLHICISHFGPFDFLPTHLYFSFLIQLKFSQNHPKLFWTRWGEGEGFERGPLFQKYSQIIPYFLWRRT